LKLNHVISESSYLFNFNTRIRLSQSVREFNKQCDTIQYSAVQRQQVNDE
jgi:hypothetical protein